MTAIVVVDSSILLNILNVPMHNQHLDDVLDRLDELIEAGDHLFIPMAAIVEVGNHIGNLPDGGQRRAAAGRFVRELRKALRNEAPWKPINFPSNEEVLGWLNDFEDFASRGVGMGDLSITKEYDELCMKFPMSRVWVWTLDQHLLGLDRPV